MVKDDMIEMSGVVIAARGNGMFVVKPDDSDTEVLCRLSGKIQKHNIKISEGSLVKIEVSVYNLRAGRIFYRVR